MIHKPQLFNSTKLGRDQINAGMKPTMNKSVCGNSTAFRQMTLTNAGETVAKNVGPCAHWQTTYNAVIDPVHD